MAVLLTQEFPGVSREDAEEVIKCKLRHTLNLLPSDIVQSVKNDSIYFAPEALIARNQRGNPILAISPIGD